MEKTRIYLNFDLDTHLLKQEYKKGVYTNAYYDIKKFLELNVFYMTKV